ncbi:MAG: NTPase [Chloroflexota bacterium]|nr:NTPase [Chloroflexota bacterium]
MKPVYLLTGRPGTGKTSIIKQVVAELGGRAGGFYTEEIREHGTRQGFRLVTLDGCNVVLAHVSIRSPYRVSKYGVDIDSLDRVGVTALHQAEARDDFVVVDEIGKMELFSADFKETVLRLIEGEKRVLGTIMLNSHPWADDIKRKPQVNLVEVTRDNHPRVLEEIRCWLQASDATRDEAKHYTGSPGPD